MTNGALRLLISFAGGAAFSLGLAMSRRTDPARVIGFLDVTGAWDPTLAVRAPICAADFPRLPARIDRRLVAGAILFGAGWGLAGYCPAPALASVGAGVEGAAIFVAAMIGGMGLHELVTRDGSPI